MSRLSMPSFENKSGQHAKRRMEAVNARMEKESELTPKSYEEIRRRRTKTRAEQLMAADADAKMSLRNKNKNFTLCVNSLEGESNREWKTMVCKKCDTCVVYPTRELYDSHMKLCHPTDQPNRSSPEKSFPKTFERGQREEIHIPKKRYKETKLFVCDICDRHFQSKSNLLEHRLADHIDISPEPASEKDNYKLPDHLPVADPTEGKMKNLSCKKSCSHDDVKSTQPKPSPK